MLTIITPYLLARTVPWPGLVRAPALSRPGRTCQFGNPRLDHAGVRHEMADAGQKISAGRL